MAVLYPDFETILISKVKPEPGELHLLKYLVKNLDDSFEIYFNPMLNGDRPDIVILRKGFGVLIIEVKDYHLESYNLDERKNWVVKYNNAKIKSPISQVLKYKENLYNLHIPQLLEKQIFNFRFLNVVSCAIYFHNASRLEIENLLVAPYQHDVKYKKFLKYNINFIGRDNFNELYFDAFFKKIKIKSNYTQALFSDELYTSFKRFLSPPLHLKENGKNISYSRRQIEIIHSQNRQQRIKGVVGSGKTTILAARAVQAYKRTKGRILILTYNITLKNYIHDKINQVREEFPWSSFTILNYHTFINNELNNLGIDVSVPEGFNEFTIEQKEKFFENSYYSNKKIFQDNLEVIVPYDAIFIDEIQDYKRPWMEIIKEFFLVKDGEYVLFGDVKQNIYNNLVISKDLVTNVYGVNTLKECFRSDFKIKNLAVKFQENIFKDKYEIDDFNKTDISLEIQYEPNLQGYVNYMYLQNTDNISSLYTIIHDNIINKNFIPNDITILSHSIGLLKKFDSYYRYSSYAKTNTMFETSEMVNTMLLNKIKTLNPNDLPSWINKIKCLIKRNDDYAPTKAFEEIGILLTIYDLAIAYPNKFDIILNWYCEKFNTSSINLKNLLTFEKEGYDKFKSDLNLISNGETIKNLRNNKKLHFYMNSGTVKLSTIHSFKGWESETVFLIIEKKHTSIEATFDEILYTGLTRSRKNLIIINFGNEVYNLKLKEIIESCR